MYEGRMKMMEEEDFFVITREELESVDPDIPADPSPALIKKILGELPSQIEYLSGRTVECKKQINDLKLLIRTKKDALEREKSRIRQDKLNLHKKEQEEYFVILRDMFKDVIESKNKVAKTTLTDVVNKMKPEKPTKSDLDDIANLESATFQEEIVSLEEQLNVAQSYHDLLEAKVKRYDNKLKVAIAHKGILVAEMQNHL